MMDSTRIRDIESEKARRRVARKMIGEYHEQQLRLFLAHVRHGFDQLDAGKLDPFEQWTARRWLPLERRLTVVMLGACYLCATPLPCP